MDLRPAQLAAKRVVPHTAIGIAHDGASGNSASAGAGLISARPKNNFPVCLPAPASSSGGYAQKRIYEPPAIVPESI
jgi:hypothetical protein